MMIHMCSVVDLSLGGPNHRWAIWRSQLLKDRNFFVFDDRSKDLHRPWILKKKLISSSRKSFDWMVWIIRSCKSWWLSLDEWYRSWCKLGALFLMSGQKGWVTYIPFPFCRERKSVEEEERENPINCSSMWGILCKICWRINAHVGPTSRGVKTVGLFLTHTKG